MRKLQPAMHPCDTIAAARRKFHIKSIRIRLFIAYIIGYKQNLQGISQYYCFVSVNLSKNYAGLKRNRAYFRIKNHGQ